VREESHRHCEACCENTTKEQGQGTCGIAMTNFHVLALDWVPALQAPLAGCGSGSGCMVCVCRRV